MLDQELIELQEKFENWRNENPSKKGGTPEYLKQEVVSLAKKIPLVKIVKGLNISYHQLYEWQEKLKNVSLSYTKIESPLNNIPIFHKQEKNYCIAEIELKNGSKIRFFTS